MWNIGCDKPVDLLSLTEPRTQTSFLGSVPFIVPIFEVILEGLLSFRFSLFRKNSSSFSYWWFRWVSGWCKIRSHGQSTWD